MKRIFFCLAVFMLPAFIYAQKQFVADANAEVRTLSASFNTISVSGGIDLYLSQSDNEAVAVSASDQKYTATIKTVVENNILKIYCDGDRNWNNRKNRQMKAYVSFRDLQKIDASGACDIVVAGSIKVSSLLLKLSGACDFKGDVSVNSLNMDLSGASDVKISGTASVVNIESSGASDVKGFELITDVCTAKASGASDVNITVNKEMNAHASGASDIYYKGSAVIKDVQSSGASSVGKKDR